jgi:two-component system chemotaxis response regulator CheB
MIRVAIADDSPFTCKLLASFIEDDADCQVVGMAHDAHATLDLIRTTTPDVLTLDLQMPGADGLELLQRITAERHTSVVVVSGVTRLAAAMTLRALELGAVDFVLKFTPGAPVRRSSLKREILGKIKMAAAAPVVPPVPSRVDACAERRAVTIAAARPIVRRARLPMTAATVDGGPVVIGASTGGLRAISELLEHLPGDFKQPSIIVQHLPASFSAPFAAQLERHARIRVKEAAAGDRLEAGVVLVTPGDQHLLVRQDGAVELMPVSDEDPYRPSIDRTMMSVAEQFGAAAAGVLLTGMGADGVEGLRRIRDAGGHTYVQDAASCVVASMPERAIEAGVAGYVGRPERIAHMIARGRR